MTTTFIGLPIEGDINAGDVPPEQWADEVFAAALVDVFRYDAVKAIRWYQYTPYFNDGDPCVFSTGEPKFRFDGLPAGTGEEDEEDDYDEDPGYIESYGQEWKRIVGSHRWEGQYPNNTRILIDPPNPAMSEAVWLLSDYIDKGHFNDLLLKLFGDHCRVTATREKFEVAYYEHD